MNKVLTSIEGQEERLEILISIYEDEDDEIGKTES